MFPSQIPFEQRGRVAIRIASRALCSNPNRMELPMLACPAWLCNYFIAPNWLMKTCQEIPPFYGISHCLTGNANPEEFFSDKIWKGTKCRKIMENHQVGWILPGIECVLFHNTCSIMIHQKATGELRFPHLNSPLLVVKVVFTAWRWVEWVVSDET